MALTDIEICSRALIRLGAKGITSFSDGNAESEVANALYLPTKHALLSSYPWSFATAQKTLTQSTETPFADYQYVYDLPSDFLRAISSGSETGSSNRYRLAGNKIHANTSQLTLTYIYDADEVNFPPFFDSVLISRLAAEFSIPVTESTSRTETLYNLAEKEIIKARQIDSQQDTPQRLRHFNLIDVRG